MLAILDKVSILQMVDIFKGLPFEDLVALSRIARTEAFRAGSLIFRQGDAGDCLYVLIDGRVTLALEGPKGISPITTLRAKDCFGEMSILDDNPRSATALAAAHCVLLSIGKRDFNKKLLEMPDIALEFLKLLSNRVRKLQSGGER